MNWNWETSKYKRTINGVTGVDIDKLYGFQCKDLVNAYAEEHVKQPFTSGNAESLWRVNQPGWIKQKTPRPGDVFVMWFSSGGIEYGHTGIVTKVNSHGFYSLDQNWYGSSLTEGSPPQEVFHVLDKTIRGFLRPAKEGNMLGNKNHLTILFKQFIGREPRSAEYAKYLNKDASLAYEYLHKNRKDLPTYVERVANLNKALKVKDIEIARLKALSGDTSEATLLGKALIKFLATFGFKKG